MHKPVWFWKELYPLLVQFCRREGLSFNEVVNLAVEGFLGKCDLRELRLKAKLAGLLREESELRKVCSCMLRSGAYLPSYAEKVLKEQRNSREFSPVNYSVGEGDRPLRALNRREEKVFRKICARREEIAQQVAEVQSELLKGVKPFEFEFERSQGDKNLEGGERQ